jgi:hypothetical protein
MNSQVIQRKRCYGSILHLEQISVVAEHLVLTTNGMLNVTLYDHAYSHFPGRPRFLKKKKLARIEPKRLALKQELERDRNFFLKYFASAQDCTTCSPPSLSCCIHPSIVYRLPVYHCWEKNLKWCIFSFLVAGNRNPAVRDGGKVTRWCQTRQKFSAAARN